MRSFFLVFVLCFVPLLASALDILEALGLKRKESKRSIESPRTFFDHALSLIQNRTGIVIDVGANGGFETRKSIAQGREVLAVECLSSAYMELLKDQELMRHSNVTLLHLCAGDKAGIMQLHLARDSSSLISNNIAEGKEREKAIKQGQLGTTTEDVVVMPLDRFVSKEVALIKIDTQGFEYRVVLGLQHTVRKYLPVITYEDVTLNPGTRQNWVNSGETYKFLKEKLGYVCEQFDPKGIDYICKPAKSNN